VRARYPALRPDILARRVSIRNRPNRFPSPCAPPEPGPAWENLSAPASRSGRAALFGIGMRSSAFHPVFIRSLPAEALKL